MVSVSTGLLAKNEPTGILLKIKGNALWYQKYIETPIVVTPKKPALLSLLISTSPTLFPSIKV